LIFLTYIFVIMSLVDLAKYRCCLTLDDVDHIVPTSECKFFAYLAKNMVEITHSDLYKYKVTLAKDFCLPELEKALDTVRKWTNLTNPEFMKYVAEIEDKFFFQTLFVLTYLGAPEELRSILEEEFHRRKLFCSKKLFLHGDV
jgi:hypothetical protein